MSGSHNVTYVYRLIQSAKNWTAAQQYCRQHYTDLATFKSLEESTQVMRPSWYSGYAWIGLFDDPASWRGVMGNDSNSWRWSATGNTNPGGFQNWAVGQPNYYAAAHTRVAILRGQWYDGPYWHQHTFVCFTGKNTQTFLYYVIRVRVEETVLT